MVLRNISNLPFTLPDQNSQHENPPTTSTSTCTDPLQIPISRGAWPDEFVERQSLHPAIVASHTYIYPRASIQSERSSIAGCFSFYFGLLSIRDFRWLWGIFSAAAAACLPVAPRMLLHRRTGNRLSVWRRIDESKGGGVVRKVGARIFTRAFLLFFHTRGFVGGERRNQSFPAWFSKFSTVSV